MRCRLWAMTHVEKFSTMLRYEIISSENRFKNAANQLISATQICIPHDWIEINGSAFRREKENICQKTGANL